MRFEKLVKLDIRNNKFDEEKISILVNKLKLKIALIKY